MNKQALCGWVLSCFAVSCSGHYVVGEAEGEGGSGALSTDDMAAKAGTAVGGTGGSLVQPGPTEPGHLPFAPNGWLDCSRITRPEPLVGPFASPGLVWSRISMLVFGELWEPPLPLPEVTTPEWAVQMARVAFEVSAEEPEVSQAMRDFFLSWSELDESAELDQPWAEMMVAEGATPASLFGFQYALDSGPPRLSIFNDSGWLRFHPSISERGRIMSKVLIYQLIPPPPEGVDFQDALSQRGGTRRQRLETAVFEPACQGCHMVMDPWGYSVEVFDEQGEHRTLDRGLPIDTSGEVSLPSGVKWPFESYSDLADTLQSGCALPASFAQLYYDFALEQLERMPALTPASLQEDDRHRVVRIFLSDGGYFAQLPAAMAQSAAFLK